MKKLCLLLLVPTLAAAGPITVVISGNFGAPTGGSTILDNQNYSIFYTVPDPHSPTSTVAIPNTEVRVQYDVPTTLSIPGLNFSVTETVGAWYESQQPMGLWLNLMTFTGLPVGDFMVMTPLQTLDGTPLWNGLAGSLGDPELTEFSNVPVSARFFVEQNTTTDGPLPLAFYESGPATMAQIPAVPEPSGLEECAALFVAAGFVRGAWVSRRRRRV